MLARLFKSLLLSIVMFAAFASFGFCLYLLFLYIFNTLTTAMIFVFGIIFLLIFAFVYFVVVND